MRATTLLRNLLDLKKIRVCDFELDEEGLILDVAPTSRVPRCSGCDRKAPRVHDRNAGRTWRHLDMAGTKVVLRYDIRRCICSECGVRVEAVPWAAPSSNFTYSFEDQVGYLVQRLDKTSLARMMRVAWRTVGDIARRVADRHGPKDRLAGLTLIGVDELYTGKRDKYITIVTDHLQGRVVWIGKGKSSETLKQFFEALGPERCLALEAVTLDMSAAYIKAIHEAAPHAELIFDRFHVQRLVHDALDEVRREQLRLAEGTEDAEAQQAVKGSRWPLHKNPWNLRQSEHDKLSELQHSNQTLYRAYLLKESLLSLFDGDWPLPELRIEHWLSWATRSRISAFVRLARTVRKYKDGILAYIRSGLSNARNEGINRKIRTITRRAFGFHSADNLIGLIFLCCSSLRLSPVFNYPRSH